MKAVGFSRFGGPDVLETIELPRPRLSEGEVLVRVKAAAVNPTDALVRTGWRAPEFVSGEGPRVPGMDVAGVVAEIGPCTATALRIGDAVMGMLVPHGARGAYSELVAMPVESVVPAPRGVGHIAAATIPMNGLTARRTLDLLDLAPGQTLGVTGSAGTYGGYVIELAAAGGLRVIADSSSDDRQLVQSLGADVVIARGDDVADRFREVESDGVHGIADGALLNDKVVPAVRDGGGVATLRLFAADAPRGIVYHPVAGRDYATVTEKLDDLRVMVEQGLLTPRVAATYPLEEAEAAHRRLAAGGVRGRLVLTIGD